MPKVRGEKIKLALKYRLLVLVGLIIGVSLLAWFGQQRQNISAPAAIINGQVHKLEIADTETLQTKGLSGREKLDQNTGMLFVFNNPNTHCFWMKDMLINIDIVWLDASHKVVDIEHDLSPKSYPKQFCPDKPSKYVLEVNADVMKSHGVKPDQQIKLLLR